MAATPDSTPQRSAPRGGLGRFSPPDWAFMPGAALVFAGLVALAMIYEPAGEDPVVTETEYVMAGPALAQLVPGPGTGFQLVTTGGTPLARLTATASLEAAGAMSAGVAAVIPVEFEARVPGRVLRVEGGEEDVRGLVDARALEALLVVLVIAPAGGLVGRRGFDLIVQQLADQAVLVGLALALAQHFRARPVAQVARFLQQQFADHQRLGRLLARLEHRLPGVVLGFLRNRAFRDLGVVDGDRHGGWSFTAGSGIRPGRPDAG